MGAGRDDREAENEAAEEADVDSDIFNGISVLRIQGPCCPCCSSREMKQFGRNLSGF